MKFIFDNSKLNIGPNRSYKMMKEHVGSFGNVWASMVDFKNFSRDIKAHLNNADTSIFINNMNTKIQNTQNGFFFLSLM